MKNFFQKILILASLVLILGIPKVFAENKIDVEHPVNTNLNGKKIFRVDNIYPGWSSSKLMRIGNKSSTDKVDLYIMFDAKGDKKLAEKLKIYVIRQKDGSYRVGGTGDHWTLKTADEKRLYIDTLDPQEKKQYQIKIVFDKNAGNEYQRLKAKFNLEFRIKGKTSRGNTASQILAEQGRGNFTGQAPANNERNNNQTEENSNEAGSEVKGEESNSSENNTKGETKGAMTEICHHWPWWVWLLAALIYGGVLQLGIKKENKKL